MRTQNASKIATLFLAVSLVCGSVARAADMPKELASQHLEGLPLAQSAAQVEPSATEQKESWLKRGYRRFKEKKAAIFARLRPVSKAPNPMDAPVFQIKSTIDEIYNKDFIARMKDEYRNVEAYEATVESPYRRARPHEVQRYESSRTDMARWTAKEVLNSQVKELFRKADRDSSAIKVIGAVKEVTSGSGFETEAPKKDEKQANRATPTTNSALTQEEKILQTHRADDPTKVVEEDIPTKLKTKFNVIRGKGQLNFQNPIVNTSVDLKVGNGENVSVDMTKEFKKLTLSSNLHYGVESRALTMNVNKKIVDNVYLDLSSQRYTGQKNDENPERSTERAQLLYSIGF